MIKKAIDAAIRAGNEILKIYEQDFEVEYKADESPLTAADKASHEIIISALGTTPYPVLSEESGETSYAERTNWSTYWLVDPLDGTKEFIKKNGEFTVNIALIENGTPILGIVYVPVAHILYFGDARGAYKAIQGVHFQSTEELLEKLTTSENLQRLDVSKTPSRPLRVVASKSHCNDETREFIANLEKRYGKTELVSRGSSLKLCMVAEGAADIYPRIAPTMEWDTAAAHAIVKAAHGEVYIYDTAVPSTSYLAHDAEGEIRPLHYNKNTLLNPSFIAV